MTGLASLTLVAGLTVAVPASATTLATDPSAAQATGETTVEQELRDELAANDSATFWVYLKDQADFSTAASLPDRDEQGWAVYEELTETAQDSQANIVDLLEAEGVGYESYWIANTVQVTGDAALLDEIAALPEVDQITADRTYAIPEPEKADEEKQVNAVEWNIDRVKAPEVWSDFGVDGDGIVIGSIDSGVQYDHPALVNQYRGTNADGTFDHNYNWWDPSNICGNPSLVPCDNNNHGTHTVGTMVGDDGADNQIGVAPGATWMAAKGCETSGCSQNALLESGQFMLAPTDLNGDNANPELRPHIINNSWGGGADNDPWYQATVQAWVAAGIFPQFASGNPGSACGAAGNPGNLAESYSAGGFDINDNLYVNSGRGPSAWGDDIIKPNIAAPAVGVRSSIANGSYGAFTGTSMASPHVAGAVALIWAAAPSLARDIDGTRAILDGTAIDTEDLSCGGTAENNNVWGQGKLDVLAAIEESPTGPVGTLAGTVTDAADDSPISGATVTFAGDRDRERTTDEEGEYSINLPVGEYDVTVTAFGYESDGAPVTVTEDETTIQDFALTAAPNVIVSGTVTDGSGHGWPVYTNVSVDGTTEGTFTDPLTGAYSLRVPVNASYTVEFEPQYPGYDSLTETIDVAESDVTVDASIVVDPLQCQDAAGYRLDQPKMAMITSLSTSFRNYFEGRGIAVDFFTASQIGQITGYDVVLFGYNSTTVNDQTFLDFLDRTDAEGAGVLFLDHAFTTNNGIRTLSRITGNPASTGYTSSGGTNNEAYYEITQTHPILDGFDVGDRITVEPGQAGWLAWFDEYVGEGVEVIANAGRSADGTMGSGIGVHERDNNRHALLSVHSQSSTRNPTGWSAEAEEIFWNAVDWIAPGDASFECVPIEGGLVLGNVLDQNTDDGINGASVASVSNPDESTETFATPTDPALEDGFYWMFTTQTGSQEFTASAGNYSSSSVTVNVAADSATAANFVLGAGQLTVDPTEIAADVAFGRSAEDTFTVTNTGTAPAEVDFSERRGAFEILNTDGSTSPTEQLAFAGSGGELTRIPADVSFSAAGDDADAVESEEVPSQDAWEALPDMPRGIMDNNVVLVEDTLYSFGGTDGSTAVAEVYAYDTGTGAWEQIDDAPAVVQQSANGVIDGQVYLAGSFSGLSADTWIYDPAANSWDQGAAMPAGRAAPGSAVLDGQLYVVGGCTTSSCAPMANTVFRYDPGSDTWETLAPYPESAAFISCGPAAGVLACAGGVNSSSQGLATTYTYDPATDQWQQRADMPVDLWASSSTGANDLLLVSGGAALNGAVVTNEGYAYDPVADAWAALPAAGNAMYRGGGACGFYKAGGSIGSFNEAPYAEVLPGFDDCGAPTDVPWLTVDPTTATLDPGDSITVTVSMDSSLTEEQQPGAYLSGVGIRHDTPYQVDAVDVTMNVAPPNNWGKITGTVTSDTEGGDPIAGAIVQVNGSKDQVTLTTGPDGAYGYWLAANNSPLQLVVAAAGHLPQTRDSQLKPRQMTVQDFALQSL